MIYDTCVYPIFAYFSIFHFLFFLFRLAESTERKIRWAVDLFKEWVIQRNNNAVEDTSLNISPILVKLADMTKDEINYSLSRFICEIKKQNGNDFPGTHSTRLLFVFNCFLSNGTNVTNSFRIQNFCSYAIPWII